MNSPNSTDGLEGLLRAWRVQPARDPQFRSAVRQRLETGRRAVSWMTYLRLHGRVVAGALAVAIVAGAFAGREQARARTAAASGELASVYVQGLDARMMRMP